MVFFIPVLLAVAGIAVYKDRKDRKRERQESELEATSGGRLVARNQQRRKNNRSATDNIDPTLADLHGQAEILPAYQRFDHEDLSLPAYSSMEVSKS
ncbi:hypothetical protein PRZ48_013837, partial [Zasmidium cellare]